MKRFLFLLFFYCPAVFAQSGFERTYSVFQYPVMSFIEPLKNGGYIVCGKCSSYVDNTTDFCFFKVDDYGNILWKKQFKDTTYVNGTPMNEDAQTLLERKDGSLIFGGSVRDPNYTDGVAFYGTLDSAANLQNSFFKRTNWVTSVNAMLLKSNGSVISTRDIYEGAGHHWDSLEILSSSGQFIEGNYAGNFSLGRQNLVATPDGGYGSLALSESYFINPPFNYLPAISRFDSLGNKTSYRQIQNEVYTSDTQYTSICATRDTGFMICGYVSGSGNIFITRFNSNCDSIWTKSVGGFSDQYPATIQATIDGGYAIAGRRDSDVLLLKLDSAGTELWSKTYGGSGLDEAIYFQQTSDDGFILLAKTTSFGPETVYLIKTDALGNTIQPTNTPEKADPEKVITLYPDPFSSSIHIVFPENKNYLMNIFDVTGRNVFSENLFGQQVNKDFSFLPKGFYYAVFFSEGQISTKKILKK